MPKETKGLRDENDDDLTDDDEGLLDQMDADDEAGENQDEDDPESDDGDIMDEEEKAPAAPARARARGDMPAKKFNAACASYFREAPNYDPRRRVPLYAEISESLREEYETVDGQTIGESAIREAFERWVRKNKTTYESVCQELIEIAKTATQQAQASTAPNPPTPVPKNPNDMNEVELIQEYAKYIPKERLATMLEERWKSSMLMSGGHQPKQDPREKMFDMMMAAMMENTFGKGARGKDKDPIEAAKDLLSFINEAKAADGAAHPAGPYHEDPGVAVAQVMATTFQEGVREVTGTIREAGGLPRKKNAVTQRELEDAIEKKRAEFVREMTSQYGQCPVCHSIVPKTSLACAKCGFRIQQDGDNTDVPQYLTTPVGTGQPNTPFFAHRQMGQTPAAPGKVLMPSNHGALVPHPPVADAPSPSPVVSPVTATPPVVVPETTHVDVVADDDDEEEGVMCGSCGATVPSDAEECPHCHEPIFSELDEWLEKALNPTNGFLSVRLRNKINGEHSPERSATGLWNMADDVEDQKALLYIAQKDLEYIYSLTKNKELLEDFECPDLHEFYSSEKAKAWIGRFLEQIRTDAKSINGPFGAVTLTDDEAVAFDERLNGYLAEIVASGEPVLEGPAVGREEQPPAPSIPVGKPPVDETIPLGHKLCQKCMLSFPAAEFAQHREICGKPGA